MSNKKETTGNDQKQDQGDQSQGQQGNTGNIAGSNTVKDPDNWTTGDEPMTGAQGSYLKTLSDEAGEPFDEELSKAEASKRINELQQKTGRGLNKDQS
ncbi:MAG TPA: DUF3072 domain-containing protein [Chitinophagaceae bacterium]|jgi:hypothetical protein|nr:DUF3072 domain-containing protein [Chitinophagaceae bacterium]